MRRAAADERPKQALILLENLPQTLSHKQTSSQPGPDKYSAVKRTGKEDDTCDLGLRAQGYYPNNGKLAGKMWKIN